MSEWQEWEPAVEMAEASLVRQTILKLPQLTMEDNGATAISPRVVPESVVRAMQQLIATIAEVRSPARGWPLEMPPTPENLTPYVLEPACHLVEALHNADAVVSPTPAEPEWGLMRVEDWTAKLLWSAIGSGDRVMRWVGGVPGRVFYPDLGWQTGMLRLVVGLQAQGEDIRWFFDLASDRACISKAEMFGVGIPDALIESEAIGIGEEPISWERLTAKLCQQLAIASPELARFMEPTPVSFLQPGSQWQDGQIQLGFDFEFIADPELDASAAYSAIAPDSSALQTQIRLPRSDSLAPLADALPHPKRVELYRQSPPARAFGNGFLRELRPSVGAIERELIPLLLQIETEENPATGASAPDLSLWVPQCVAAASRLLEEKNILVSHNGGEKSEAIDQLIHRLLWQIIGSGYDMMQLMVGVQAEVLQPHQTWEKGMLRVVGILQVQTPMLRWEIDLASGQMDGAIALLPATAIVQSSINEFCRQAIAIDNLLTQLSARLPAQNPFFSALERQLLSLQGSPVELCLPQGNWQPGWAHLRLAIEFIAG